MSWISLNIENFIIITFAIYVSYFSFNLPYRVRRVTGFSMTKPIKLLDCFPCGSFWFSLVLTGNPIFAMAVFLTSKLLDNDK